RHGRSERDQQQCTCDGDPHTPDSQYQSYAEEELSYGSGPRQKWNRRGRHERVYFGGIAYKSCEISVADISPTVKSKAVSNPGEECSTKRNARTQSRPTWPVRPTRFVPVLTRFHVSSHSCGVD